MSEAPATRRALRVVVAGGGVAGLETLLALRELAPGLVKLELVAPEPRFWYRPLAVAEPFALGRAEHFELSEAAAECGAGFTLGAVTAVDAEARVARTAAGGKLPYDVLVLAAGARPVSAVPGAFTFRGPADSERLRGLLDGLANRPSARIVYAVPVGATWPLPLYELALLTARHLDGGHRVTLVTPESRPVELFGSAGAEAVAAALEEVGVELCTERHVVAAAGGWLDLAPSGRLPFDELVALPVLRGAPVDGIPQNRHGFVPTDEHGRVAGLDDVYAVGDITTFPVKQGGIAAQQADAVASQIAARAGAPVDPLPFRPVLRGLLLTGGRPAYLRTPLGGGAGDASEAHADALWWPPGKIVGRYLSPYLAARAGAAPAERDPAAPAGVRIEVDLSGARP